MRRSVIIPILHASTAATSLAVPPSPDSHRPDGNLQCRNGNTKNSLSGDQQLQTVTASESRLAANAIARLRVPSCPDCSRFLRRPHGGGASGPRCVQIELSHLVEQGLITDAQHFRRPCGTSASFPARPRWLPSPLHLSSRGPTL